MLSEIDTEQQLSADKHYFRRSCADVYSAIFLQKPLSPKRILKCTDFNPIHSDSEWTNFLSLIKIRWNTLVLSALIIRPYQLYLYSLPPQNPLFYFYRVLEDTSVSGNGIIECKRLWLIAKEVFHNGVAMMDNARLPWLHLHPN